MPRELLYSILSEGQDAVGGVLSYFGRHAKGAPLYRREAIAVVGLSWILATLLGALPYWLSGTCGGRDADANPVAMDLFDGVFESASGFTGTGATVLADLEDPELVPRAILFWRSQTHFLGGLGIVGESENYAAFHGPSKFVLSWLMLLGRLEAE